MRLTLEPFSIFAITSKTRHVRKNIQTTIPNHAKVIPKSIQVGLKSSSKKTLRVGRSENLQNLAQVVFLASGYDFPSQNGSQNDWEGRIMFEHISGPNRAVFQNWHQGALGMHFCICLTNFAAVLDKNTPRAERKTPQETKKHHSKPQQLHYRIFGIHPMQIYAHTVRRRCHACVFNINS